ncbi:MAG: tetratricopeptide repeat protein [Candidatus Rokubacteria bacterium]|nr:tetratricopeptide repeat protein [Candidatus Rokubacteria bacterium]MBI2490861.1 tetratricopeptide repeat protein [Candidatus Rokubacteria bacterium]
MRRPTTARLLAPAIAVLCAATLGLGWWEGRRHGERADGPAVPVLRVAARDGRALVEEAIRLYAAGQFPRACDRLSRAADGDPSSASRRAAAGSCFEGWGWQALTEGRPDEATLLFRQGLAETPEAPALLKGLGLAAVHAGRPEDALGPLERAVRGEPDTHVRLLLAHLYDRRDDPDRAIAHLRALLARDPGDDRARRLLDKVERERRAETGFQRDVTPRFLVKYRAARDAETRRALGRALEAAADHVGGALGWVPPERLTVVLYEREQWEDVTRVHGWATGLFDGKIRLPLGPAPPPAGELQRLVLHEVAHAAIHHLSRGRAPRWLHEGLAQALEGATADPMLRVPGSPTLAGIEALVTDADALRARAGYDIAHWIVRDLLDRGGLGGMRELLGRLGAGDALADAMPRVYGLRLAEIESQWRRLLGG